MSWFKIDDGFHCHPKVLEAGNEAIGLYVRCGSYCSQQLTEGRVPRVIALMYGDTNLIDTLVKVGLFKPVEDGWLIHDYDVYNPSREQVLAEREAAKQRQRNARERAKAAREEAARKASGKAAEGNDHAVSHAVTSAVTHGVSHNGDDANEPERHAVTHAQRPPEAGFGDPEGAGPVSGGVEEHAAHSDSADVSRRDFTRESRSPRPDPTRPVLPSEVIKASAADAAGAEPAALFDSTAVVVSAPAAPAASVPDTQSEQNAGALVAEWIESRPDNRPPGRTIGHAGKELRVLLEEDRIPYETVRAGFMAWARKGCAPSAIASFVNEEQSTRARGLLPGQRMSTTDQRVTDALALAAELRAEEQQNGLGSLIPVDFTAVRGLTA